jgi:hypothetical protein
MAYSILLEEVMKALPKILFAVTAVAALSVAYPARANFIGTIDQVGTKVVATGSGTIDLTGLSLSTNPTNVGLTAGITPNLGALNLASAPATKLLWV